MKQKRASLLLAEQLFCDVVSEGKEPWYAALDDADRWYPQWDAIIEASELPSSWSAFSVAVAEWSEKHPDAYLDGIDSIRRTWEEASSETRARLITGYIYNDTDLLPVSVAAQLHLPEGISYASAVRRLRRSLGDRTPGVASTHGKGLRSFTFSVDDEGLEKLQAKAKKEGVSVSAVLRSLIDSTLEADERSENDPVRSNNGDNPRPLSRGKRLPKNERKDENE